jgi:protein-disulfide isomerase
LRKTHLAAVTFLLIAGVALAADEPKKALQASSAPKAASDPFIQSAFPECGNVTISRSKFDHKLPSGMRSELVSVDSPDDCKTQQLEVRMADGRTYVGTPWFIDAEEGTAAERIRSFTWKSFHESFQAEVDPKPGADGFLGVKLSYVTEHGKVPIEGIVDRDLNAFYLGRFYRTAEEMVAARQQRIDALATLAPSTGPKNAPVTLVEFSDFECPSCRRSTSIVKEILDKYPNRIRYVRIDLPLSGHPWAFTAAVYGRAIYGQNPEVFWAYKKAIYDAQSELNAFTLDDFVRGFVKDHDLDVERFNKEIESPEVRQQILDSIGAAFSVQVQATPSYFVNGQPVATGKDGANLERFIEETLKAKS